MGGAAATTPSSSSSSNNPGRERAVEALLDREPQGDYCRVVRVVDEAFSLAQSSRPNLITRAALVDQAFALSAYDINTIEKYDLHLAELSEMIFPPAAPTAVDILNSNEQKQQQLDAVTRDRIIQYQTNLLTAKRLIPTSGPSQQHHEPPPSSDHPDTTGFVTPNAKGPRPPPAAVATTTARRSLNCTPPATLVAALRRVCCGGEDEQMDLSTAALAELSLEAVSSSFEDTTEANDASTATKPTTSNNNKNSPPGGSDASRKSSFDFRQLLQSVYSHAVFPHSIIQTTTTVADDDVGETGSGSSRQTPRDGGGEDDAAQNVNLEKLILNVAQLVADPHADSEDTLQALLMAIVSLSTARSQQQPLLYKGSPLGKVGTHIDITDLSSVPVIQTATRQDPDDLPIQSFLQVGPLMSVFSCTPSLSPSRSVGSASPATNSLDKATAENKDGTRGNTAPESDGSAATDVGHLEPALLEYFASAAAVYQERSEIQAVWRLQRATRATAEAAAVLADSEKTSNAGDFLRPQTPLPDLVLSSPLSQKDDENDHTDSHMRLLQPQVLDEDSYDSIAERPSETPTASSNGNPDMEDSQRDAPISSNPPTIDDPNVVVQPEPSAAVSAALSVSRNDEAHDVMAENEVGSSDSESEDDGEMSDQDDGGDDDEEPYESHSEGMMDDVATGLDDGEHPDHDDVEAGDDSSSSESSDDDGIGDSDGDAVETDEDDEVFLRQALALSMAAQQEVAAPADREGGASDEGTLTIESTHILVVPSTENDIQSFEEAIAPALEESLAHLSSSVTVTADAEKQPTTTQPDDTEANYPPFPNPPELYFDFCSKSSISAVRDDPDAPIPSRFPIPSLNPSEFGEFGSLPTSHVLVQLLRFASNSLLERHLFVGLRPEVPSPLVTGGMCTTLFSLDRQSKNHQPLLLKTQTESIKDHVSVLLLVVSLILFIEQRNDAIENLLQAFKREQRVVRQSDVDTSNDDDIDDESTRAPMSSSGEEDDPALAFAMNYVEDDVPLSESLENKGMMRKAAAAAHDVAAMVESLRARTQAWKTEVALLSTCAVYALRMLSRFIQTVVRHSLPHDTTNEATTVSHSFRLYRCLPVFLSSKVTDCLTSLITVGTQDRALFGLGYDEIEAEGSFLSLRLYREALCLWGEFVPLLYTSESSRLNLLELSISDCSAVASQLHISPIPDVSRLTTVPTTEIAPQVHKLKVLCRRLRISDMLDGFVSRPIPFVHEIDEKMSDHDTEELSKGPHMSSYLVSLLGKSTKNLIGGRIDVECLLYAVCHRYHTKMLLLDGFYAASPTESIDRYSSASSAKTLSTGDTVRVATGPSPSLQFDASNCSDSIALIAEHGDESADMNIGTGSVHQRASKVWGTVLSTHQFSPKTGVHRWAVRLDKCERGHVFIGVSTAQASTSTYVGGDKFGWGMIGTQALWHDRRKIRGDYGATFRTGSIIIITFDSDVGSLSFSIWKDNSSSSSFSLDPLVQNIVSPRRSGQVGGTVEHWGIAFEGLPLDAKLYPAVGLYQRDDRVTLLSVESSGTSGGATGIAEVSGGDCFFPRPSLMFENVVVSERATKTRQFNSQLMWDGIRYTTEFLQFAVDSLRSDDDNAFLVENLLPSLASSLCLFPQSVPVLSARCALHICPNLSRTVLELQSVVDKHSRTRSLFYRGMREGRWTIRTSSSMSTRSKFDEYTVDFNTGKISGSYSAGFEGTGSGTIGKSKCGAVKIIGCLSGSSLSFIEDWTFNSTEDSISSSIGATSSSAILARISLNGDRFEGVYHNVQSGIAGHVVGILSKEKKNPTTGFDQIASTRACAALFCLAQSHLATILCDDTAGDIGREDISNMALPNDAMAKQRILKDVLTGPLFSRASLLSNNAAQGFQVAFIKEMYSDKETSTTVTKTIVPNLLSALDVIIDESIVKTPSGRVWTSKTYDQVCLFDDTIAPDCGGFGSLRSLSFTQYMETRRKVISSIIFHCYICDDFCKSGDVNSFSSAIRDELKLIWRTAVKIVESTVRKALSRPHTTASSCCVDACDLLSQTAAFLLDMQLNSDEVQLFTVEEVAREVSMIYVNVDHKNDLAFLEVQMSKATSMGLMRLLAFQESSRLLSSINVQNMELAELLINGFPRLLGRGRVDTTMTFKAEDSDDHWMESLPAISGSYLSQLSGIDLDVKGALRNQVSTLLALLGPFSKMAVLRCGATTCQDTSNDSLAITLISIFMGQFQQGDLDDAMMDSGILSLLECMFSVHRSALTSYSEISFVDEADGLTDLAEICKRDVSRVLLRSAIAASHVLTYQVSRDTRRVSSKPACLIRCLESLLTEFTVTSAQIEDLSLSTLSDNVRRRLDDEWQNWYSTQFADKGSERPAGLFRSMTRVACFCYFREHGTILNNGNAQPQKSTPSKSMPGSLRGSESRNKSSVVFSHQLLSHWLDVLCMVLRSRQVLSTIAKDKRWMIILFRVIGLTAEVDTKDSVVKMSLRPSDDGILPARFRARLIRLMLPFLSTFEPCEAMVEGLLYLAGATSALLTKSQDVEECFVSREAISLLRQLHSPRDSRWRETINISISTIAAGPSNDSSFFGKKVGILSFFSGSLETVCRGSYVLLKPSTASALMPDHQLSPSSKSQLNGIGGSSLSTPAAGATPHHLVGNGTSSVIAGLSRSDASAGIVSNVDIKNGFCEIILVDRDQVESKNLLGSSHLKLRRSMKSKSSAGGRHTLTVRALRVPLADTVHAQEFPLYLDTSVPFETLVGSMLNSSLDSILSAVSLKHRAKDEGARDVEKDIEPDSNSLSFDTEDLLTDNVDNAKSARLGVLSLAADLMTIRCCMVLLSDQRILSSVNGRKEIMSKLLELAWPNDSDAGANVNVIKAIRNKGLWSLPIHEATFGHLVALQRDLNFRMQIMKHSSNQQREGRMKDFRSLLEVVTRQCLKTGTSIAEAPSESISQIRTDSVGTAEASENAARRSVSHSTEGNNSDEEEENETSTTATNHLREAAIAQMAELGLPRSWSELALRKTGGTNIEAAVTFCLERGSEIERMLADEQESDRLDNNGSTESSSRGRRHRDNGSSSRLLRQLLEMGFPKRWCAEALAVTGNDVDVALTWILSNGERLSEEDEALDAGDGVDGENSVPLNNADDEDEDDEDDDDDTENGDSRSTGNIDASKDTESMNIEANLDSVSKDVAASWNGSIIPLRFISGRAIVDPVRMEISGLSAGGFSSVGTKGVLLTSGKWYYEAVLETAGCLQIGWADGSFAGHCHADRGDGCGDGPSSWAFDGWRRYRWHATATEWGCRWKQGDVVGCLVDMDERVVAFTLNGQAENIGMGVAFTSEGFRPCGGVYACVSFNRKEKLRFILGGNGCEPFKYPPPISYRGVGEAVLEAVQERDHLLSKENVLDDGPVNGGIDENTKSFLCDFSDGDHGHELMAWAHRYYGSDASVHLGSSRPKSGLTKPSVVSSVDFKASSLVTRRLMKVWTDLAKSDPVLQQSDFDSLSARVFVGYEKVQNRLTFEIFNECLAIGVLLSRKLLLHVLITEGKKFDPTYFDIEGKNRLHGAKKFWNIVETCTSLRRAGWVGEAGAMAIAAEAVGLGISSNEQLRTKTTGHRLGVVSVSDIDEGIYLPTCGYTQVLSSVIKQKLDSGLADTTFLPTSCAEAALGSDGGSGLLAFLQDGLSSLVCGSTEIREVLIASTRRAVRHISTVEYDCDDFDASDTSKDSDDNKIDPGNTGITQNELSKSHSESMDEDAPVLPDARLAAFVTGLLLSRPVQLAVKRFELIQRDLFEAWSVGLLSASLPWRMICALTTAGILNQNPSILSESFLQTPTLARYFGRLQSTVARRLWAERASVPVCSRYAQAMVELLTSVQRSVSIAPHLPADFVKLWGSLHVDASTPLSLTSDIKNPHSNSDTFWESDEGWVTSDCSWEVWTGSVEFLPLEWKTPSLSSVRTLMDGGDGPPMLREGCFVMRGIDWNVDTIEGSGTDDGKDAYDTEKAERDEKKRLIDKNDAQRDQLTESKVIEKKDISGVCDIADPGKGETEKLVEPEACTELTLPVTDVPATDGKSTETALKKIPCPKLPIGTVLGIEPWKGIPGMARRVKWNLTGEEGVYRFGGDGGRYDICHVEVNSKYTRLKKRHPLPESSEQCAARHGFGSRRKHVVLLRLRGTGVKKLVKNESVVVHDGILEWPDFGAGIRVVCTKRSDGSVVLEETQLLFGSKDSGWMSRFGQPSFVPGCTTVLSPVQLPALVCDDRKNAQTSMSSLFFELRGTSAFNVSLLRNPANGEKLVVNSEMRFQHCKKTTIDEIGLPNQSPLLPPITFDCRYHAPSLSLSSDGRTVSCISSDGGRGTVFASMGFTKGVHYWEVKLEQADIGSVFIGVAEKPIGSGSGSSFNYDSIPRLNRWHGWGFVNFRATYTAGAERIFGSHCHAGDTVGVLLDCDAGRVSFFFDGLKYGEHILNDLGCAFENVSPFGFNMDGCGSGGAGQGAPSGFDSASSRLPAQGTIKPRTLWPVIGLRNQGDRITLSSKWNTTLSVDGAASLSNIVSVDRILSAYDDSTSCCNDIVVPHWFMREAFVEYQRWSSEHWNRSVTRGSGSFRLFAGGLDVDFDASPMACAAASSSLGLGEALLAGDRVRLTRSAGRLLELAEEAVVLGAYQGRLYYRIVSQKSEGGSLHEGGGRAWCWDESEVVDMLPFVSPGRGRGVPLPKLARFTYPSTCGLRVVYENGAVLRSDLEISDVSVTLGTIPFGTVISKNEVLDRRVNSYGIMRFRVVSKEFGEGWISARIRGGKEDLIVELAELGIEDESPVFLTPMDCAVEWHKLWKESSVSESTHDLTSLRVGTIEEFAFLISKACIPSFSALETDSVLTLAINAISKFSDNGDALEAPFRQVVSALSFSLCRCGIVDYSRFVDDASSAANHAAAVVFASFNTLPSLESLLARLALLRSFNRRARLALPWMSIRPCQEGSSILGGLYGHGTSPDRAGRARVSSMDDLWVQVPSMATKIRKLRGIVFTSVKRDFIQSIIDATTTPTPLSHDEYELPREIRTVRINRLKAARAMLGDDRSSKRKYSILSQLHNETKNWGGAGLRRGYVAKGHGGQKRAFKVKLIGEGVNDYSGPYREVFTDAIAEVVKTEVDGASSLGVLDPSPNNMSSIGDNRDLFMFSLNDHQISPVHDETRVVTASEHRIRRSFASLLVSRDESSREVEESLVFLGRLAGTAFRHGITIDLPLPLASVWKALTEEPVSSANKLRELDELAFRQLGDDDAAATMNADDSPLLLWQQRMLNAFAEGLGNVLPIEIFPLLTGEELRDAICGNPDVDVELLQRVVEYEGYEPTDPVIGFFWTTLLEMTNAERKRFLQFVWARNRLPLREADFDAPFKIQKDTVKTSDQALPSASTCFFTLTLPPYSSQDVLRDKLLFAINNVTTMETDFQTNSAEIAEGYRSF